MKKAYTFIRSMRFGMLLLAGIGILCILATVSGNEKIYSSWYFILLFAVLGLNLSLCSFQRVFRLKALKLALVKKAENSPDVLPVPDAEAWLRRHRFVRQKDGSLLKNRAGFLGSSLTHGAMLLLMLSAGFIFAFAQREDLLLCVGDTAELPDGTQITVGDFRLEDESGRTEYLSELSAVLPDGSSMEGSVRVNHPLCVGRYTVYQQNYSYAAVIGVSTETNREEETVKLSEAAFLSLDGENGIYYSQMFGNVAEENGEVRVSHGQELVHPAYEVISSLNTGPVKVWENSKAGWQPKSCCSHEAKMWSRLGKMRLISYVSGYHHDNSNICIAILQNIKKPQGIMR